VAAGPILIFDKSALQALSLDESVWLDHFFLTNITPVLYVEALADLEKVDAKGRSSEVALITDLVAKTPVFHPYPNVFHGELLMQDLLGHPVPMTGQIALAGGVRKPDRAGGVSVHFQEPPEVETIRRWNAGQFEEVERRFARQWRVGLAGLDFTNKIELAQRLVPPDQSVANLESAKAFADSFVGRAGREVVTFAQQFLEIPDELIGDIDWRYTAAGRPPFKDFAPYAAFVLTVDLVFYLGMGIGQISDRRSNMIDVSYLYYLPFCMVFTSGDKLHARLAPLFLRPDQQFIGAAELKAGLRELNAHYSEHREEIERVGVLRYAPEPPVEVPTVISTLWERALPRRGRSVREPGRHTSVPSDEDLLRRITEITTSRERLPDDNDAPQPDSVILQHEVPVRRGSWRLLPEGVEDQK
jgi:hypothetical protein